MPPPMAYCPNGGDPYNGGGIALLLWGLALDVIATPPLLPLLPLGLRLNGDILRDIRAG
jgi:hypothetical protein